MGDLRKWLKDYFWYKYMFSFDPVSDVVYRFLYRRFDRGYPHD